MVLFPMPGMGMPQGSPTPFALSMRKWVILVLILQALCAFARFYVLDIFGGFFMLLTCGIGYYSVRDSVDMTWLTCWGVMVFINGIFDTVILISRAVKSPMPFFSKEAGWLYNTVNAFLLLGPISEFLGAWMAYLIYKDHQSYFQDDLERDPFGGGGTRVGGGVYRYGAGDSYDRPAARRQDVPQSQNFRAFQGDGQRLGSA